MSISLRSTLLPALLFAIPMVVLVAGCGKGAPESGPGDESATPAAPAENAAPAPAETGAEVAPPVVPVADWLIVPGERIGPLTATSTAADLVTAYGAPNVRDEPYPLGEGESEPGTAIFPDDPTKRMVILWNDLDKKARPLAVRIDGAGSQWKTAEGLAVGTTLKKVEELNGKPFRLYGFEWDFGGQLVDSNGGNLKDLPHEDPEGGFRGGALLLTFQPDPAVSGKLPADQYAQVSGDSTFESSNPVMQAIDPKISAITVNFPDAE